MTYYRLSNLTMTGRCANGFERGHGTRVHAVPDEHHGNGRMGAAVCGARPGLHSAGWSEPTAHPVTCPRCARKLEQVQP